MSKPTVSDPNDELPDCPVCGNHDTPADVYSWTSGNFEGDAVECNVCHAIIPLEALKRWDAVRRQPPDARLLAAIKLLQDSAGPFDQACIMLRQLASTLAYSDYHNALRQVRGKQPTPPKESGGK